MPVLQSKSEWKIVDQESEMKKGPLVRVKIGPGQYVKIREGDLKNKKKKPPKDKKIDDPGENKIAKNDHHKQTIEPGSEDTVVFDDLTEIKGIGKASERLLNENGISTFAQLAAVGHLDYLSDSANEKIESWRSEKDS